MLFAAKIFYSQLFLILNGDATAPLEPTPCLPPQIIPPPSQIISPHFFAAKTKGPFWDNARKDRFAPKSLTCQGGGQRSSRGSEGGSGRCQPSLKAQCGLGLQGGGGGGRREYAVTRAVLNESVLRHFKLKKKKKKKKHSLYSLKQPERAVSRAASVLPNASVRVAGAGTPTRGSVRTGRRWWLVAGCDVPRVLGVVAPRAARPQPPGAATGAFWERDPRSVPPQLQIQCFRKFSVGQVTEQPRSCHAATTLQLSPAGPSCPKQTGFCPKSPVLRSCPARRKRTRCSN